MMTDDDKALLNQAWETCFPLMEESALFIQFLKQSDELKLGQVELSGFLRIVERWHQQTLDIIEFLGGIGNGEVNATDTGEAQQ